MNRRRRRWFDVAVVLIIVAGASAYQASSIPAARLIQPDELAKVVQGSSAKPLILQVGSRILFQQAHIPGSEYVGNASTEAGLQALKQRVEVLPKKTEIVLYCGCCPWNHCPNVAPAEKAMAKWGFSNVKTLYIANNFGVDWVQKGFPLEKGD
jgi:thiosulfate/3-mercaptopyruvate sulfurtransferase